MFQSRQHRLVTTRVKQICDRTWRDLSDHQLSDAGNKYLADHEEPNNTGEEPSLHSNPGEPNTQTILSLSVQR